MPCVSSQEGEKHSVYNLDESNYRLSAALLQHLITFLIKPVFLGFSCTSVPPYTALPLSFPHTPLISRKVESTEGRCLLKSWQEKASEVCPTRKTLMGHPGERAGSCLQHYTPVYNNALTETWVRTVSSCWMSPKVSCHSACILCDVYERRDEGETPLLVDQVPIM